MDGAVEEGAGYPTPKRVGLLLGPLLLAATLAIPPPAGLSEAAWWTAGTGLLMAVWWSTEAIPIPATALLPLALFPLLGVAEVGEAAPPYAHPLIFLFLGGFLLAAGMERWGLPRRLALTVAAGVGAAPAALVAGFMGSSALMSMWVSNTATALIMLPIGVSVLELVRRPGRGGKDGAGVDRNFGAALMLGIAYGASVGGLGTLIGTPPNAFLAGFLSESYGIEIGFVRWMGIGLPMVLAGLPVVYLVLTRLVFPVRRRAVPGAGEFLRRECDSLGPLAGPERSVAIVFGVVALLWILRPVLEGWMPGLSDPGIAVAGGVALFLIPADLGRGEFLLGWEEARELPWGVLILFGGGLSLARSIEETGLSHWIGDVTAGLAGVPLLLLVMAAATVVVLLTELTSNTATAAAFLPVLASVAVGVGDSPLVLAVPTALAASCAFMLPVATPPNAIVYGSGAVSIPEMVRAGLVLNVCFVLLVALLSALLLPVVFGVGG